MILRVTLAILTTTAITSCAPLQRGQSQQSEVSKIKFQLDDIHSDGLRGPPDGLRSVAYEFCVPKDERVYQEVKRIDPSVEVHSNSRGRIGCGPHRALCIGQTHQPRWREVLDRLSSLAYVAEIRESIYE